MTDERLKDEGGLWCERERDRNRAILESEEMREKRGGGRLLKKRSSEKAREVYKVTDSEQCCCSCWSR